MALDFVELSYKRLAQPQQVKKQLGLKMVIPVRKQLLKSVSAGIWNCAVYFEVSIGRELFVKVSGLEFEVSLMWW